MRSGRAVVGCRCKQGAAGTRGLRQLPPRERAPSRIGTRLTQRTTGGRERAGADFVVAVRCSRPPTACFLNLILSPFPKTSPTHSRSLPLCCERIATLGRCSCTRQQPSTLYSRESPVNIPYASARCSPCKRPRDRRRRDSTTLLHQKSHTTSRPLPRDELFT